MGAELDKGTLDDLKEVLGGESVNELIQIMLADAPNRLVDFQQGLAKQDWAVVRRAAHTLKSSCANLGAKDFAKLCEETEAAARVGDAGALAALAPDFSRRLAQVITELKQYSQG